MTTYDIDKWMRRLAITLLAIGYLLGPASIPYCILTLVVVGIPAIYATHGRRARCLGLPSRRSHG